MLVIYIKYRNYKNNFNFGNRRKFVFTGHHYNEVTYISGKIYITKKMLE